MEVGSLVLFVVSCVMLFNGLPQRFYKTATDLSRANINGTVGDISLVHVFPRVL